VWFCSCSRTDPVVGKWEILEFRCAATEDEEQRIYSVFKTVEFFEDGNALLAMQPQVRGLGLRLFTGAWTREGDSLHVTWMDPDGLTPSMEVSLVVGGVEDDLMDLTGVWLIPEKTRGVVEMFACDLVTVWRQILPGDT
jgi:hypothetical protein